MLGGRDASVSCCTCSQQNSVWSLFPSFLCFYHTIRFGPLHSACFTFVPFSYLGASAWPVVLRLVQGSVLGLLCLLSPWVIWSDLCLQLPSIYTCSSQSMSLILDLFSELQNSASSSQVSSSIRVLRPVSAQGRGWYLSKCSSRKSGAFLSSHCCLPSPCSSSPAPQQGCLLTAPLISILCLHYCLFSLLRHLSSPGFYTHFSVCTCS